MPQAESKSGIEAAHPSVPKHPKRSILRDSGCHFSPWPLLSVGSARQIHRQPCGVAPLCLFWHPSGFCSSGPVFICLLAQDFDTRHAAHNQALQAPKAGAGLWRAALCFSQWPETDSSLASWALGSIFPALSQGQNTTFQIPGSCKVCSRSLLRHTRDLEPGLLPTA